jgi:hypothetical protein
MKRFLLGVSLALLLTATGRAAETTTFWVEPCSVMIASCDGGDADLARWALAAWETASAGRLHFAETKDRANATIRVLWADKNTGLYGEAVPVLVNGRRGSELHILVPEPNPKDPLLRSTIVYLTCLHESGHALGLAHTRAFPDIMYSFQYGGDIDEYFGRYRRLLSTREDIRKNAGMSPADRAALLERVR